MKTILDILTTIMLISLFLLLVPLVVSYMFPISFLTVFIFWFLVCTALVAKFVLDK